MKINAVVLAAKANTGQLASVSDESFEANIDIHGKPMLAYTLSILEEHDAISRIIVVGPKTELKNFQSGKTKIVNPGGELIENVKIGLDCTDTEFVLVSSSDIPLLTRHAFNEFVEGALRLDADFVYAVSTKEECDKKYPGVHRTYVKIKHMTLTGGNLFLVKKKVVWETWPVLEKMLKHRKSPLKMASTFGIRFLAKVFLGLVSLHEIEEYVSGILNIKCKAILSAPEVSVDVDKPEDLELVRYVLEK